MYYCRDGRKVQNWQGKGTDICWRRFLDTTAGRTIIGRSGGGVSGATTRKDAALFETNNAF